MADKVRVTLNAAYEHPGAHVYAAGVHAMDRDVALAAKAAGKVDKFASIKAPKAAPTVKPGKR